MALTTSCCNMLVGVHFTNGFSITLTIRRKFRFALIHILIQWALANLAHGTTAVLRHVQTFVAILWLVSAAKRMFLRIWITKKKVISDYTIYQQTPAITSETSGQDVSAFLVPEDALLMHFAVNFAWFPTQVGKKRTILRDAWAVVNTFRVAASSSVKKLTMKNRYQIKLVPMYGGDKPWLNPFSCHRVDCFHVIFSRGNKVAWEA